MFIEYDIILDTPILNRENTKQFLKGITDKNNPDKRMGVGENMFIIISDDKMEYRVINAAKSTTALKATLTPVEYLGRICEPCYYLKVWESSEEGTGNVCLHAWHVLCCYIPMLFPIAIVYDKSLIKSGFQLCNHLIKVLFSEGYCVYRATAVRNKLTQMVTRDDLVKALSLSRNGEHFYISETPLDLFPEW